MNIQYKTSNYETVGRCHPWSDMKKPVPDGVIMLCDAPGVVHVIIHDRLKGCRSKYENQCQIFVTI